MSQDAKMTVAVLSQTEDLLGFLNPNYVQIKEGNELYGLRGIDITHPLVDDNNHDLSLYTSMLQEGNKIWRRETCDEVPCLYVLLGEKYYDFKNNQVITYAEEVAGELGEHKIVRSSNFNWVVNSTLINTYCGELFSPGTLTGPSTPTNYNGALTPLMMLREIEKKTGGEFEFIYSLQSNPELILRTLNFKNQIGKIITTPIEIDYNTDDITLKINEQSVASAAAPIGKPESASKAFHQARKAFEDQAFSTSTQIPLYVTKNDDGTDLNGPMAYPPYNKPAGQKYLECTAASELVASYQRIHQKKSAGSNTYPRICTFESSEENKYNLYWDCVDTIRAHLKPTIEISAKVVDIEKLMGNTSTNFCVGDTVYVRLPDRIEVIPARILKTTKDPRSPESDSIEIGNQKINYHASFFKQYYKPGCDIEVY